MARPPGCMVWLTCVECSMPRKRTIAPAKTAKTAKTAKKRTATRKTRRRVPLLRASDLRLILHDLSSTVAPGDVEDLLTGEAPLRATAAGMKAPELALLRRQLDCALDC